MLKQLVHGVYVKFLVHGRALVNIELVHKTM
jgi:hypothetical protein